MVTVPALCNLKDTLQQWFTFFDYFDGVKLDWTSVRSADLNRRRQFAALRTMQWVARHQVRFRHRFQQRLSDRRSHRHHQRPAMPSMARVQRRDGQARAAEPGHDIIITA